MAVDVRESSIEGSTVGLGKFTDEFPKKLLTVYIMTKNH